MAYLRLPMYFHMGNEAWCIFGKKSGKVKFLKYHQLCQQFRRDKYFITMNYHAIQVIIVLIF